MELIRLISLYVYDLSSQTFKFNFLGQESATIPRGTPIIRSHNNTLLIVFSTNHNSAFLICERKQNKRNLGRNVHHKFQTPKRWYSRLKTHWEAEKKRKERYLLLLSIVSTPYSNQMTIYKYEIGWKHEAGAHVMGWNMKVACCRHTATDIGFYR